MQIRLQIGLLLFEQAVRLCGRLLGVGLFGCWLRKYIRVGVLYKAAGSSLAIIPRSTRVVLAATDWSVMDTNAHSVAQQVSSVRPVVAIRVSERNVDAQTATHRTR